MTSPVAAKPGPVLDEHLVDLAPKRLSFSDVVLASDEEIMPGFDGGMDIFEFLGSAMKVMRLSQGPHYFRSSQQDCDGEVDVSISAAIIDQLNAKIVEHGVSGIYFDKSRLEGEVYGGTCSSMALEFATRFRKLDDSLSLVDRIDAIKDDFFTSGSFFRNEQAAMNTISVKPGHKEPLFRKVQALALSHDFIVDKPQDEFYFQSTEAQARFNHLFFSLENGIHFIRVIQPPKKEDLLSLKKQEVVGHSMILIRNFCQYALYDPCRGVYILPGETPEEFLFKELNNMAFLAKYSHGSIFKLN